MYKSETSLEVRYYETDLMGIVHHSNYIRYFECARHQALVDLGLPINKIENMGIMMPVVSVECHYKKPATRGDTLKIISTVSEMPKVKIKIDSVIYNINNEIICTGSVTLGFIHADNRRPTRIPSFISQLFAPYFK